MNKKSPQKVEKNPNHYRKKKSSKNSLIKYDGLYLFGRLGDVLEQ